MLILYLPASRPWSWRGQSRPMNLRVRTTRILALRPHLLAAFAVLAALSLPLAAQSPQAVQEEGRVVWTNDSPRMSSTEGGAPKEYFYWSNTEQRWKPVRAASPRALRQARAVAGEVSSYMASRPGAAPAEASAAESKTSRDVQLADKSASPGYPLALGKRTACAAEIDRYINEAAARHHVDPNLVRALIKVESNFNPRALSSKGAMGLMQLMPATARQYDVNNPFDAAQNVDAGVRHLKGLLDNFRGDVSLTLAAYNAGQGAVERNGGIPPYTETRNYVRRITGLMAGGAVLGIPEPGVAGASMPIEVRRDERGRLMISNTD